LSASPTIAADLHNHSTCSDGELSPAELVTWARELGLEAVAITDHDTIEGLAQGLEQGRQEGVEVICGVEVTTRFTEARFKGSLHLLLYFAEELLQNSAFVQDTGSVLARGRGAVLTRSRVQAINRCFAPGADEVLLPRPLTEEDIYTHGHRISRRHFALALREMGLTDRQQLTRIIGNDSPAYIPSGVPPEDLQQYLSAWPVVRILAHPAAGSFPGESHYKEVLPPYEIVEGLLDRFDDPGLDGFEVNYPAHTPQWRGRLLAAIEERGLTLATGGSDCHDRQLRPLGVCGVSHAMLGRLKQLIRSRYSAMANLLAVLLVVALPALMGCDGDKQPASVAARAAKESTAPAENSGLEQRIIVVAQKQWAALLSGVPQGEEHRYGLPERGRWAEVKVGRPLEVMILQPSRDLTDGEVLAPLGQWRVPLVVKGEHRAPERQTIGRTEPGEVIGITGTERGGRGLVARNRRGTTPVVSRASLATGVQRFVALVTVARHKGRWQAVDLGAAVLAADLQQSLQRYMPAPGSPRAALVRVFPLRCDFLMITKGAAEARFYPLTSARKHLGLEQEGLDLKTLLRTVKAGRTAR